MSPGAEPQGPGVKAVCEEESGRIFGQVGGSFDQLFILGPAEAGDDVANGVALGPRALPAGRLCQKLGQVMALGLSQRLVAELPVEHRQIFLRTLQAGKCEITRLHADPQEVEASEIHCSEGLRHAKAVIA